MEYDFLANIEILAKTMPTTQWLDMDTISSENNNIANELGLKISRDFIYSVDSNQNKIMYKIIGTMDQLNEFKERTNLEYANVRYFK